LPRLVLAALLLGAPALAQIPPPADPPAAQPPGPPPRPYETTIAPTGDDALDTALRNASRLVGLQTRAPTDLPGLIARAAGEPERLRGALDSEGYFAGTVRVTIAGQDPLSPDLPRRLPAEGPIPVTVTATPNLRYVIRKAEATAVDEAQALREAAGHVPDLVGQPARAAAVVEAQARVISGLLRAGHPFAAVQERDVVVDHDARAMDFSLKVSPAPSPSSGRRRWPARCACAPISCAATPPPGWRAGPSTRIAPPAPGPTSWRSASSTGCGWPRAARSTSAGACPSPSPSPSASGRRWASASPMRPASAAPSAPITSTATCSAPPSGCGSRRS
jgi:hypothetical protein